MTGRAGAWTCLGFLRVLPAGKSREEGDFPRARAGHLSISVHLDSGRWDSRQRKARGFLHAVGRSQIRKQHCPLFAQRTVVNAGMVGPGNLVMLRNQETSPFSLQLQPEEGWPLLTGALDFLVNIVVSDPGHMSSDRRMSHT